MKSPGRGWTHFVGVELPRRAGLEAMVLPAILRTGAAESLSKGYYGAPKPVPITGLQVLLQRGALRIAGD